jgi:hypothetical protein
MQSREAGEAVTTYLSVMERIPAQAYFWLAMGSIVSSALLFIMGKRNWAIFVGQWPSTFLLLALVYKLLRPSREHVGEGLQEALHRGTHAA